MTERGKIKMKRKTLKKGITAMVLAAMLCTVPAQSVFAFGAEKTYNMEYSNESMNEQMKAETANTTMTLKGDLDNTWYNVIYNNSGSGELFARFENLPTGADFANKAYLYVELDYDYGDDEEYWTDYRYRMWLIGDTIFLADGPQDFGNVTVAESPFGNADYNFGALFGTLQNGVNYDVTQTIDWLYEECVNNNGFESNIRPELVATTYKKTVFVGVDYAGNDDGWGVTLTGLSTDAYKDEEQTEDMQEEETTVEETTVEETVQEEVVYVQPEVTQGDLVYTVKAGDTLGSISANYYGDNSKASVIRTANKEAFAAAKGKLTEGMQLILPEKLGSKARIAEPTADAGETLYTVMHGDTLCKIAKAHYGTEKKIAEIFARNSDRLSDSSKLFPGQVIVLPAN